MKGALLLDIVIRKSATIFQLLTSKDETLLIRWNSLLILDLGLHVIDGVGALNFQGDRFSGESLDEDLHTTTETKDKVERGLFLNVVVRKSTAILQLLSGENQALLVWRNSLLILNLRLYVVNGIRGLDFQRNRLSGKSFHENLHTTTEAKNKVECGLLLDVVVGECTAILKLLSGKNETLLVWRDPLLILDFRLDVVDSVRGLHFQRDRLPRKSLNEYLHSTTKTQDKVKSGLFLDVVIGQSTAILELLACENQTLLVGGNALLVLNLRLDIVDRVTGLHLKGDGLASKGLDDCKGRLVQHPR